MFDLDTILCLVGHGSRKSPSLRQAQHLARCEGASLHLLPLGTPRGSIQHQEGRDETPRRLRAVEFRGPVYEPNEEDVSVGDVDTVLEYVSDANVDLVLLDTPADRGPVPPLSAASVGSLIERLDCSVFVVSEEAPFEEIEHILVPTDLSLPSILALRHAIGLASLYGATVELLHVMDRCPYVALTTKDQLSLGGRTLIEHRAHRRLQQVVRREEIAGVSVHPHLGFGTPADKIVHCVTQEAIDLLVLSSHGTSSPSRQPFGRVADRVLRRVTCPLFLVRALGRSLVSSASQLERSSTVPLKA